MTTAQQDADTAAPRDLTDAAVAREKAKAYIEQFQLENRGALPSGQMVADHVDCGLTDKWGRNQLKPFRPAEGTSPAGPSPQRPSGSVRELAAARAAAAAAAAADSGPATAVIGPAGTARPPAAPPVLPAERLAPPPVAAPERSGAATGTASGTATGTAKPRTGTPAAAPTGTLSAPLRRLGRSLGEAVALLPLLAIAAGAFVSIWGGWVGLGKLTGFGEIELLPGIVPGWKFDTAITLPLGMEAYAAYALKVWLAPPPSLSEFGRTFARRSAIGALILGAAGQIAYHLMAAAKVEHAHWLITAFVACLPVGVLGCGAALMHLVRHPERSRP